MHGYPYAPLRCALIRILLLAIGTLFICQLARADVAPFGRRNRGHYYPAIGKIIVHDVSKIPGLALLACMNGKYVRIKEGEIIDIPTGKSVQIVGITEDVLAKIDLIHLAPVEQGFGGSLAMYLLPDSCIDSSVNWSPRAFARDKEEPPVVETREYVFLGIDSSREMPDWHKEFPVLLSPTEALTKFKGTVRPDESRFRMNKDTNKWESLQQGPGAKIFDPAKMEWTPAEEKDFQRPSGTWFWEPRNPLLTPARLNARTGAWQYLKPQWKSERTLALYEIKCAVRYVSNTPTPQVREEPQSTDLSLDLKDVQLGSCTDFANKLAGFACKDSRFRNPD